MKNLIVKCVTIILGLAYCSSGFGGENTQLPYYNCTFKLKTFVPFCHFYKDRTPWIIRYYEDNGIYGKVFIAADTLKKISQLEPQPLESVVKISKNYYYNQDFYFEVIVGSDQQIVSSGKIEFNELCNFGSYVHFPDVFAVGQGIMWGYSISLEFRPYVMPSENSIICVGDNKPFTFDAWHIKNCNSVKLANEITNQTQDVSEFDDIIEIKPEDLPEEWYNTPLKVQVYNSDGILLNETAEFYFIAPPPFKVFPTPPKCHNGSGTLRITNIPKSLPGTKLRVNIEKVARGTSSSIEKKGCEYDEVLKDSFCWVDQKTLLFDMHPDSTSLYLHKESVDNSGGKLGELSGGFYRFKVFHYNVNEAGETEPSALCSVSTKVVEMKPPAKIIIDSIETDFLDNGFHIKNNGGTAKIKSIKTNVSVDNPEYYFKKDVSGTVSDTFTITDKNFTAGSYKFYLKDSKGCSSEEKDFEFEEPPLIVKPYITINHPVCNASNTTDVNKSTGSIVISKISGGITPYSYQLNSKTNSDNNKSGEWETPLTTIEQISPDTYDLTISDKYNTISTESYTITAPKEMTLSAEEIHASCNLANNNGKVKLKVTNGTTAYTFFKGEHTLNDNIATELKGGYLYNFKVKDTNECLAEVKAIIDHNPLIVESIEKVNPICEEANGSVSIKFSGGSGYDFPILIRLYDGWGNINKYHYYKDYESTRYTLGDLNLFDNLPYSSSVEYELYINFTGDEYLALQQEVINADHYYYMINGWFRLDETNPLKSASTNVFPASCSAIENGSAILTVSGLGTNTIDSITHGYSFSASGSNITVPNLAARLHNISLTDSRGCTVDFDEFAINVSADSLRSVSDKTDLVCPMVNNGSISIKGINGRNELGYNYKLERLKDGIYVTEIDYGEYFSIDAQMVIDTLSRAMYRMSVKDRVGCIVQDLLEVKSNENPITWNNLDKEDATCAQASNGKITINDGVNHSGSKSLSYFKNNVQFDGASNLLNNLPPAVYEVKIIDEDGCYVSDSIEIGSKGYVPDLKFETIVPVACQGKETAQIKASLVENELSLPDYNFKLKLNDAIIEEKSGVEPTVTFNKLLTNLEYTINLSDANNCSKSFTYTPELLEVGLSLTENWIPAPCSDVNGRIEFAATGGFSPSVYNFYFNETIIAENVSSGFIEKPVSTSGRLRVVDSAECELLGTPNQSVALREYALDIKSVTKSNPLCIGALDGTIGFELVGNSDLDYHYKLYKTETSDVYTFGDCNPGTNTISNLPAGNYSLHVFESALGSDTDGVCSYSIPGILLQDPNPITVSDLTHNYIQYFGTSTGAMEITIEGGNNSYNYEIIRNSDNKNIEDGIISDGIIKNITPLSAGSYLFRFRDVEGCNYFDGQEWFEESFTIEQPDAAISLVNQNITHIPCFNYTNGRIQIEAAGGWGNSYQYSLKGTLDFDWQSEGIFENLIAGNYTVLVRDTANAIGQWQYELLQPSLFQIEIVHTKDATCPNYFNGEVEAIATNGVYEGNGITYSVTNLISAAEEVSQNSAQKWRYNNLPMGNYQLLATDQNGCFHSENFVIAEPDTIKININKNYIKAKHDNTGVIDISAILGNGNYDYKWYIKGNDTPLDQGNTSGTLTFASLLAGEYQLMLKDTANCNYEGDSEWMVRNIKMEEPEIELSFSEEESPVSCNGLSDGKIQFIGIGGWGQYKFSFNNQEFTNSTTVENLEAHNYMVTVKDSSGVEFNKMVTVTQPDILTVESNAQISDIMCFDGTDGSISVNISGGNSEYQVSVNNIDWADGNIVHDLPIGTYDVFVKDAKGCETSTGPFELTQPPKIFRENDFTIEKSTCEKNEGAIIARFGGGVGQLSYSWIHETINFDGTIKAVELFELKTPSISKLYAGKYIVNVKDSHDCIVDFDFHVNDNTSLSISSIDTYPVTCYGYTNGSAKVNVTHGNSPYNYRWPNGINAQLDSAWNMKAGDYYIAVTDSKNCYISQLFKIETPDSLFYNINHLDEPLCLGGKKGALNISATGGTSPYQYLWSNNTIGSSLINIEPGKYNVTITDNQNCVSNFNFSFNYQREVKPFLGNDTIICHYNTLVLDAGNYNLFNWQSSKGLTADTRTIETNTPASYYLTVTDVDNCIGFDTIQVDVSILEIATVETKNVTCAGFANGEALVSINSNHSNYSISWPNGNSGYRSYAYSGGEYSVVANNLFGCSAKKEFSIFEPLPLVLRSSFKQPLCYGVNDGFIKPVVSGGTEPYSYKWDSNLTTKDVNKLTQGVYTLNINDANHCLFTETFELPFIRNLQPNLGPDRTICLGNHIYLTPGEFFSYKWFLNTNPIGDQHTIKASQPGKYNVEVRDVDNCLAFSSVEILAVESKTIPAFLMASSVPAGDTLLVVDVTNPKPSSIEWIIDHGFTIVESGDYYCKVIFSNEGIYNVTLLANSNESCIANERKTVLVTSKIIDDENSNPNHYYSNMKSLSVAPNPSKGHFTASLELNEPAEVNFYLVRIESGQIYETRKRSGLSSYSEDFSHSGSGTFVLFTESAGERLMKKIIVF